MRAETRDASLEGRLPSEEEFVSEVEELRLLVEALRKRVAELEAGAPSDDAEERLRHSEEEIRETRERLAHVNRMSTLGEMATGIAHEINQPLAAVATYAQACGRMIRSRMTDDVELLDTLDRISREALRAGAIINRLKDLVRRGESRQSRCDLNEVIGDVVGLAEIDAQHNGVRLSLELADDIPPVIADRIQIQQVVLNLIRNGMEALEDAPVADRSIVLQTRAGDDGTVRVTVRDRGVGISADGESALFTPFYTTKESGMGMGLSISRSILRAHGGCIWFTRNPDVGATFHFSLPIEEGDETGGPPVEASDEG